MKTRRWLITHLRSGLLAVATVGLALPAMAASANLGAAIDVAGRQRMLTQRVVKAYCQLGLGVTPEASRAQLDGAVRRFDQQLAELARDLPNAEARQAHAGLRQQWQALRRRATGEVSRDGARQLAALSEDVLRQADQLVTALQDASGTPQARLVNLSGRQRMLSQRLAKLYMLQAYGVDTPAQREELDAARREFETALTALRAAPQNTTAIHLELDAVALQWEWFKHALALQGTDSFALVVGDASESMLNSMERITARYTALSTN